MKTSLKTIVVTAAAILAGFGVSGEITPGEPAEGGTQRPRFRRPPPESRYDLNQDGTLDESERAALPNGFQAGRMNRPPPGGPPRLPRGPHSGPPPQILEQYDANKDGHLDESEHTAVRQAIEGGTLPPPQPPPFGHRPAGTVNPPSPSEILERFDNDKDGKLDAIELTEFLKARPLAPRRGPGRPPMQESAPATQ